MVLAGRPTNQGIRFVVGICIIALSIYGFYIALARKNSPELFLIPAMVDPPDNPCTEVLFPGFSLCAPSGLEYETGPDGTVGIRMPAARVRGEIRVLDKLPREDEWRASLRRPLIRAFLGHERSMGTRELLEKILGRRYNPTLMGIKSQLIPSWMKKAAGAEILRLRGTEAILFYTPGRFLGFVFQGEKIVMLSCEGTLDKRSALHLISSLEITSPEGRGTEPPHSS